MSEFSGSKTMANGTRVRMDPAEAKALWEAVMAAKAKDEAMMPDSAAAILLLSRAKERLRDLGWRDAIYCPKDGSDFAVMQFGSTGVFRATYIGEWPDGYLHFDDCASRPQGCLWKPLVDLTGAEVAKLADCEDSHRVWMDGQVKLWGGIDLSDFTARPGSSPAADGGA